MRLVIIKQSQTLNHTKNIEMQTNKPQSGGFYL